MPAAWRVASPTCAARARVASAASESVCEVRFAASRVWSMLDALGLPCVARYGDDDFVLAVWRRGPARSVAQREGIRA